MHCCRKLQRDGVGWTPTVCGLIHSLKELNSLAGGRQLLFLKVRSPNNASKWPQTWKCVESLLWLSLCLSVYVDNVSADENCKSSEKCSVCEITLLLVVNQQGDNKKMEDAKCYLTLPYTKVEMEEKETPSGKSLHHLANFTPNKDSTKDSFQIATLICSTKLTQNGRSLLASQWYFMLCIWI